MRRFLISGILQAVDPIPAEKLDQNPVEILGPGADHNLSGGYLHTAKGEQMPRNGFPKIRNAAAWDRQK